MSAERKEALLFTGFFRQKHPRKQKAILFPQGSVP